MLFQVLFYIKLNKNALLLENVPQENIGLYSKTFLVQNAIWIFSWYTLAQNHNGMLQELLNIKPFNSCLNFKNFISPQQYLRSLDNLMPKCKIIFENSYRKKIIPINSLNKNIQEIRSTLETNGQRQHGKYVSSNFK